MLLRYNCYFALHCIDAILEMWMVLCWWVSKVIYSDLWDLLIASEDVHMTFPNMILLFITAFVAGAINSVAGGGSFFSFPALVFTGVPPIQANATNTVALWPGSVASVGAYRRELSEVRPALTFLLIGTSLIGGILGAILLLKTSQSTFEALIPFLLLIATLLFALSPYMTAWLRRRRGVMIALESEEKTRSFSWISLVGISVAQLIISIYGGYFGGGIGILMLASLGMMGMENIHVMNALKTVLASCINGIAVITFVIAGAIVWPQAILMIIAAVIGGYGGAYYARKVDPQIIRICVIVVGLLMTVYFFLKPYIFH